MPKKTVIVDYKVCEPSLCKDGICQAALLCEKKILTQEAPFEMPDIKPSMCLGCSLCMQACPKKAILMI